MTGRLGGLDAQPVDPVGMDGADGELAVTAGGPLQVHGLQLPAPPAGQPNAGGFDPGATLRAAVGGATFPINGAGIPVAFAGVSP